MLHIRPAREHDRDAVLAFTARTWEHGDYIDEGVWNGWMEDTQGVLLVGELGGQPVALTKVSHLAAGVEWYEGIRIAPEQRGRGLGRAMLNHCITRAQQRGVHTMRFFTTQSNTAMQRLAAALNFRVIAEIAVYHGAALNGTTPAVQPLAPDALPMLISMLESSPILEQSGGLYAHSWHYQELTSERLHEHLKQGEVVTDASQHTAHPRAWAIISRDRPTCELRFVWGQGTPLVALLRELRRGDPPPEKAYSAYAVLPVQSAVAPELEQAGFAQSDLQILCYELGMGPTTALSVCNL